MKTLKQIGGAAVCVLNLTLFVVGGCSKSPQAAPPRGVDVEVAEVEQRDIPIYTQWVGTLDGFVNADIKAQVTGYLLKQEYKEGSFVRKGQLLFQIDPRPFQASLDQAKAQLEEARARLANAQANQRKSQLDVDRYTPLASEEAATQQDLDNAIQTNLANLAVIETDKASIKAAEAAVETAQINLNFTRVISPIDGIAGLAQNQVGDLVSATSNAPITTVSTIDPIKVYFTPSEQEYLAFAREHPTDAAREQHSRQTEIELILADGTTFPHKGSIEFANREIDQSTGTIRIAALFPNPDNILRPGGYGQIRAITKIEKGALLVPQRAIADVQGNYQVAVVNSDDKVSIRQVKVGEQVDNQWVVTEGLRPGERVITDGVQKVSSGVRVNPKMLTASAKAGR
jgi:RND family efflux transporter MFP subunit